MNGPTTQLTELIRETLAERAERLVPGPPPRVLLGRRRPAAGARRAGAALLVATAVAGIAAVVTTAVGPDDVQVRPAARYRPAYDRRETFPPGTRCVTFSHIDGFRPTVIG